MHLDAGDVQRLLDAELSGARRKEIEAHLESCPKCKHEVSEVMRADAGLNTLLASLDHQPPQVDAHRLIREDSRRRSGRLRWAAGLTLGLGISGAAYAAPGSPVAGWISGAAEWITEDQVVAPSPTDMPTGDVTEGRGLGVDPGDRLIVQVTGVEAGSAVEIRVSSGTEVIVRGRSSSVTFTSDPGRLVIDRLGRDTVEVAIPSSAPYVEIRVDEEMVVLKEGGFLQGRGESLAGPGPFLLPLSLDIP